MGFAAREIEPGGPVHGEHGGGVGDEALRHRQHVTARRPGGARAEQRVHGERGGGPRLLAPQLADAVDTREGAIVDGVVGPGVERAHPHGEAGGVEGAGKYPAVAAVVPRSGDDERAARHDVGKLRHQHARAGAARGFHEDAAGDPVLGAGGGVPRGRVGRGEDGDRVHGITTPA